MLVRFHFTPGQASDPMAGNGEELAKLLEDSRNAQNRWSCSTDLSDVDEAFPCRGKHRQDSVYCRPCPRIRSA